MSASLSRFLTLTLTLAAMLLITPGAAASGILAPTDETLPPLRITDHLVKTDIASNIARTRLTQTFRNDTDRRLEATYIFPLPEQADLTDFRMSFNGKMVEGEVLPAAQARHIYESIVRQARDPGLIEFIGTRLLRMRLFPIEPNSDTTIELQYQQICRPISGMMGYHYPLRTSKTAGRAYGNVRFTINVHTDAPLKSIWSPTHAIETVREGEHTATIGYETNGSDGGASLEDDFILLYDTDASDLGLSLVAHQPVTDEDGHFVLMLTPKQLWPQDSRQPQDVVFVLDTSGSMAGEKIDQAKQSLRYCIDQLDEHDQFAVVRFSTGFDVFGDGLTTATTESRQQAKQWISDFTAAGGTNIADTMAQVMDIYTNRPLTHRQKTETPDAKRPVPAVQPVGRVDSTTTPAAALTEAILAIEFEPRPFVVVFLTDGQGNREPREILAALAKAAPDDASTLRIFPFGVGHDVNTLLLDNLGEQYRGRPTYVQPGEDLELVLGDFFSIVSRPVLTNLKLTLPDVAAHDKFPVTLADLYHGQQVVVAGRFTQPATGPITLTASRNGERVEYTWPEVSFTNTAEATYVPGVWAGRKIAFLLDEIRRHGENEEMIAEVIALSQQHGIQTPYTSWLVNPENITVALRRGIEELGGRAGQRPSPGAGLNAIAIDGSVNINDLLESTSTFGGSPPAAARARAADVQAVTGQAAVAFARKQARNRAGVSRDANRADSRYAYAEQIGGVWFDRAGQLLMDERFDPEDEVIIITFASTAYFDLLAARPDLKPVFAAGTHVLAVVGEKQAVFVTESGGIDEFSDLQREQLGLPQR